MPPPASCFPAAAAIGRATDDECPLRGAIRVCRIAGRRRPARICLAARRVCLPGWSLMTPMTGRWLARASFALMLAAVALLLAVAGWRSLTLVAFAAIGVCAVVAGGYPGWRAPPRPARQGAKPAGTVEGGVLSHPVAWRTAARVSGGLPAGSIRPGAISGMMALTRGSHDRDRRRNAKITAGGPRAGCDALSGAPRAPPGCTAARSPLSRAQPGPAVNARRSPGRGHRGPAKNAPRPRSGTRAERRPFLLSRRAHRDCLGLEG